MRALPGLLGEGFRYCPTRTKSVPERFSIEAGLFRPIRKAKVFAAKFYHVVISFVSGLLMLRCPNAIIRFIISVSVKPFNAMLWGWLFPHVFYKVQELLPPVANGNTPAAIVSKVAVVGVAASGFHARPNPILRGAELSVLRIAVFRFGHGSVY